MATLELAHPAALGLLALPLALLVLVRARSARPERDATGALELWKRVGSGHPSPARARAIPLSIWLCAAACALAVLALAAPRITDPRATNPLVVLVDRSPSMYLPHGGSTRLERALGLFREEIVARGFEPRVWLSAPFAIGRATASADPPPPWLERSPGSRAQEPDFSAWDRPGVVWITDKRPDPPPRAAGVCASGGVLVPGPCGVHEDRLVEWDGKRLALGASLSRRSVVVDEDLPSPIQRVARAWATARGMKIVARTSPPVEACLSIQLREREDPKPVELARDGWTVRGVAIGALELESPDEGLEPWLTSGSDAYVTWCEGLVDCALVELEEPRGDPAAWAVSWSTLFDTASAPPRECVSVAEREAAGEPWVKPPVLERSDELTRPRPLAAWLAALAALLGAVALLVANRADGSTMRGAGVP